MKPWRWTCFFEGFPCRAPSQTFLVVVYGFVCVSKERVQAFNDWPPIIEAVAALSWKLEKTSRSDPHGTVQFWDWCPTPFDSSLSCEIDNDSRTYVQHLAVAFLGFFSPHLYIGMFTCRLLAAVPDQQHPRTAINDRRQTGWPSGTTRAARLMTSRSATRRARKPPWECKRAIND
jgi:hypothetical protein